MRSVRPFEPEDLLLLEPQAAQLLDIPPSKRLEYGWQFKDGGSAFTLWEPVPVSQSLPCRPIASLLEGEDGNRWEMRPTFCGGALRRYPGYAALWGLFSVHKPRVPAFLTRAARHFVAGLGDRRVEAQVASSNPAACGWARLIGLEEETRLRAAMPDGSDMVVYVKPSLLRPQTPRTCADPRGEA